MKTRLCYHFSLIQSTTGGTVRWQNAYSSRNTHIHTHNHVTAVWILSRTIRVSRYQTKLSPTHSYHGRQSSLICFLHLSRSMASYPFNLYAWQSFHNLFPSFFWSTSWPGTIHFIYSVHFFAQSLSSFCSTCPYHRNLFCCSMEIMSSNPGLSLSTFYFELLTAVPLIPIVATDHQ